MTRPCCPQATPTSARSGRAELFGGGLVPAVVVDPSGPKHFVDTTDFNHYSLLRTIEDAWNLPELVFTSDHAQVPTMDAFLSR